MNNYPFLDYRADVLSVLSANGFSIEEIDKMIAGQTMANDYFEGTPANRCVNHLVSNFFGVDSDD